MIHDAAVERSRVTFYLNVAEQLMKSIPSNYVEDSILQACRPFVVSHALLCAVTDALVCCRYLEDPKYRDTFESAHSVLLAIFASGKECANDLAPWYTQLLLHVSASSGESMETEILSRHIPI